MSSIDVERNPMDKYTQNVFAQLNPTLVGFNYAIGFGTTSEYEPQLLNKLWL